MAWPRKFSNLRPWARIKTRKNEDFSWPADPKTGGPKRESKWSPKWTRNDPKTGHFWAPQKFKNQCNSLCFRSKWGPEGAPLSLVYIYIYILVLPLLIYINIVYYTIIYYMFVYSCNILVNFLSFCNILVNVW